MCKVDNETLQHETWKGNHHDVVTVEIQTGVRLVVWPLVDFVRGVKNPNMEPSTIHPELTTNDDHRRTVSLRLIEL